jgi:hypothetical protein
MNICVTLFENRSLYKTDSVQSKFITFTNNTRCSTNMNSHTWRFKVMQQMNIYASYETYHSTNQVCIKHCQLRGSKPSHVDIITFRNLLYPKLYNTFGSYLKILTSPLCVSYSFIGNNSSFMYFIKLIVKKRPLL